jgi:hypothetical protein
VHFSALECEWQVQFVGYEAYLVAAQAALNLATMMARSGPPEHVQRLVAFAVRAVDLMARPRCHGDEALHAELPLFRVLRGSRDANTFAPHATRQQMLEDAWVRLQRSGVLRQRSITRIADVFGVQTDACAAANRARLASAEMRTCALEACAAREVHPAQFKKCAACRWCTAAVVYCCKAHQEQQWPAHKAACKAARKAAAVREGDAAGPSGAA